MENNIRLGKISAVDYAAGTVRVVYHEKDDAGARRTSPRRVPKGFTAKTWPVRRVRP